MRHPAGPERLRAVRPVCRCAYGLGPRSVDWPARLRRLRADAPPGPEPRTCTSPGGPRTTAQPSRGAPPPGSRFSLRRGVPPSVSGSIRGAGLRPGSALGAGYALGVGSAWVRASAVAQGFRPRARLCPRRGAPSGCRFRRIGEGFGSVLGAGLCLGARFDARHGGLGTMAAGTAQLSAPSTAPGPAPVSGAGPPPGPAWARAPAWAPGSALLPRTAHGARPRRPAPPGVPAPPTAPARGTPTVLAQGIPTAPRCSSTLFLRSLAALARGVAGAFRVARAPGVV